jgi:hypothetical protein
LGANLALASKMSALTPKFRRAEWVICTAVHLVVVLHNKNMNLPVKCSESVGFGGFAASKWTINTLKGKHVFIGLAFTHVGEADQ